MQQRPVLVLPPNHERDEAQDGRTAFRVGCGMRCQYDHLQFFVDGLKPLVHYKAIEERLTSFAKLMPHAAIQRRDTAASRKVWCKMGTAADPEAFQVHGRDLVEQLLYGFGWRITAEHSGLETRSLLLSTPDPAGVKFVITCKQVDAEVDEEDAAGAWEVRRRGFGFLRADGYLETGGRPRGNEAATPTKRATIPASTLTPAIVDAYPVASAAIATPAVANGPAEAAIPTKRAKSDASIPSFDHFAASHLERFAAYHGGEQGVAVLGFEVAHGDLDDVLQRYRTLHPKLLLAAPREYGGGVRVLDVLAYYTGEKGVSEADTGTVIRFVERSSAAAADVSGHLPLPGLSPVAAEFDCGGVLPAYCDHWVSNVRSRVGFLQTLQETLGFTPKVGLDPPHISLPAICHQPPACCLPPSASRLPPSRLPPPAFRLLPPTSRPPLSLARCRSTLTRGSSRRARRRSSPRSRATPPSSSPPTHTRPWSTAVRSSCPPTTR